MVKRFTDTDKFKDKWYRSLTPKQKCIWEYLLAACDIAGFFEIDYEDISFHVGANVTRDDFEKFKDKVQFLTKDIIFNPKNMCHKGIIDILNRHKSKGYFNYDLKIKNSSGGINDSLKQQLKEVGY